MRNCFGVADWRCAPELNSFFCSSKYSEGKFYLAEVGTRAVGPLASSWLNGGEDDRLPEDGA